MQAAAKMSNKLAIAQEEVDILKEDMIDMEAEIKATLRLA